jgi:hypothetical protein
VLWRSAVLEAVTGLGGLPGELDEEHAEEVPGDTESLRTQLKRRVAIGYEQEGVGDDSVCPAKHAEHEVE